MRLGRVIERSRPNICRVGTRASPLALAQTRAFISTLLGCRSVLIGGEFAVQERPIHTSGDASQASNGRLAEIGGKGLFAKEIHAVLAHGCVDFAVHSMKDLETELPSGIVLACALPREDARDALVLGPGCDRVDPSEPFTALPCGAVIGTASARRQAQLLHARPDLRVVTIRGNVQTRLERVAAGECAATLLALAGLRRLGLG